MSAASPTDVLVIGASVGARVVTLDDTRGTMREPFTSTDTRSEPPP